MCIRDRDKIQAIATKVYGADGVDFTEEAKAQIALYNALGWNKTVSYTHLRTESNLSGGRLFDKYR